jgi:citrate lyase subunit beta/citryl-CoA lyase
MPGSNARVLQKARTLDCDVVALDLEDAVSPENKYLARAQACAAVAEGGFGARDIVIRINALASPWGKADLEAVAKVKPDAIILPKVSGPDDMEEARRGMANCALWAMIETPRAVLNVAAIAAAGAGCLILGSNDLMKEMRARPVPQQENLWMAMSLVVMAARAQGIAAIDGTFNDLADLAGFSASCEQGHAFGFDGKTLIHPSQIAVSNRIFAPSAAEIEEARRILAAFAAHPGKSVLTLDGRMLEQLHAEEAQRILALAEATRP